MQFGEKKKKEYRRSDKGGGGILDNRSALTLEARSNTYAYTPGARYTIIL